MASLNRLFDRAAIVPARAYRVRCRAAYLPRELLDDL